MMADKFFRTIILPFSLSLFLSTKIIFSQSNYLMSIENGMRINDTIVEFEIYIKSNSNPFVLTSYQCAFTFNPEIINGGNISFSYVQGSSQLTNIPFYSIGINSQDNQLKLTFASLAGMDSIGSEQKRIGKFQLRNSVLFGGLGLAITWNFSGIINTILTGTNFVNITNPNYHTNLNFPWDLTPPAINNIIIVDSTKLLIIFSEILDTINISNVSNYSITNGVNVLNAMLLSPGDTIVLITTSHTLGNTYLISVHNLKDLSGNIISPQGNSVNYSFGEMLNISARIFLQGAFINGEMITTLKEMNLIPVHQPYNILPWNYQGNEIVQSIPQNITDWVLIELRTGLSSSTTIAKRAAFVRYDGLIVDLDGSSNLQIAGFPGQYYLSVIHRNHLGVISSEPKYLSGTMNVFDFTSSMNSAYGNNPLCDLGNDNYGMYAGDADGNGAIDSSDLELCWKKENGNIGYKPGDFDLNGGVNIVDKNSFGLINIGKIAAIPN